MMEAKKWRQTWKPEKFLRLFDKFSLFQKLDRKKEEIEKERSANENSYIFLCVGIYKMYLTIIIYSTLDGVALVVFDRWEAIEASIYGGCSRCRSRRIFAGFWAEEPWEVCLLLVFVMIQPS